MPSHCIKCGSAFAADVDFCRKCGTTKKGTKLQMLVPKRAVRAAQEHNFTLLKVTFDLWARGGNAECLRMLAESVLTDRSIEGSIPEATEMPSLSPRSSL